MNVQNLSMRYIFLYFIIAVRVICPYQAHAQSDSAISETPWYNKISSGLFFSTAYSYNFNQPPSRKNQFRLFDADDNTFRLDEMELLVEKKPQHIGDAGFRSDLAVGTSIPRYSRSAGFNCGDLDFHQLFFSYMIPIEKGIRLDVGKFLTYHGYEGIEGYDCLNDNATRSFLAAYATPTSHTGIRISYPISNNISLLMVLVNGWDNSVDSNNAKTIGGQIGFTPCDKCNLYVNFLSGAERVRDDSDIRNLGEFVGMYSLNRYITTGLNIVYGTEQNWTAANQDASWLGEAIYIKFFLRENFSLCLRAEQLDDRQGSRTGIPQLLREITLTPEWRIDSHLILRSDIRFDTSNKEVFEKGLSTVSYQNTIGVNFLCLF